MCPASSRKWEFIQLLVDVDIKKHGDIIWYKLEKIVVLKSDFVGLGLSVVPLFVYELHLIQILQDTKQFAYSFQTETPIKRGVFSHQDRDLLDRIIAQVNTNKWHSYSHSCKLKACIKTLMSIYVIVILKLLKISKL